MKQSLEHRFEYFLQETVNLNSHSKNHEGVKAVLNLVEEEMSHLGLMIEKHKTAESPERTDLPPALVGVLPSTGGNTTGPTITLVTHADTLILPSSAFQSITWSSDRKRAIGPGVINNKGGILIALFVLEKLAEIEERNYTVQMICMPGAEAGSPGFTKFFEKISFKSNYIIGLDPALIDGGIVHSRRGNRWYEVNMAGPGGLAGRDAGRIPNPLEALIKKVTTLCEAAKMVKGVSLSPGALVTDTQEFSVIPASATAKLDARYDTNQNRDQLQIQLDPLLRGTEWKLASDCPAFSFDPKSNEFHQFALKLVEKHERKIGKPQMGLGSTDCNYLYRPGVMMVDGLGPIGTGLHSESETLDVNSIFTRTRILYELIIWVALKQH